MTAPIRIQRRRTKGWKMPENAVYVGRPTRWGNPYEIGTWSNKLGRPVQTIEEAVQLYRDVIWAAPDAPHLTGWVRENLRGKSLACWCAIGHPCHADVLLEIANAPICEAVA